MPERDQCVSNYTKSHKPVAIKTLLIRALFIVLIVRMDLFAFVKPLKVVLIKRVLLKQN